MVQSSNECFRADKLRLNGLFIAKGKARSLYVHIEISIMDTQISLNILYTKSSFCFHRLAAATKNVYFLSRKI
jgi:hypothetical protein